VKIPSGLNISRYDRPDLALVLMMATYVIVFSIFSIARHYTFQTSAFDLGIFQQALWNSLNGNLFYETPDLYNNPSGSFLGVHFSAIMFLLIPLYAIHSGPETLLILQSLVIALAALPLYKLATHILRTKIRGLSIAAIYLLYFHVHLLNSYDFHLEAFLPLFIFSFSYFLVVKKPIKAVFFALLAMLTMEVAPIIVGFVALFFLLLPSISISKKPTSGRSGRTLKISLKLSLSSLSLRTHSLRKFPLSLWLIVLSIAIFFISVNISSLFAPSPFAQLKVPFLFSEPGESLGVLSLAQNFFNPFVLADQVGNDFSAKMSFWLLILLPVGFVIVLRPLVLVMLIPWFVLSMTTNIPAFYQLGWQYGAFTVPPIMIGTIYAVQKISRKSPRMYKRVLTLTVALAIITALALSPLNPLTEGQNGIYEGSAYRYPDLDADLDERYLILNLIPPQASVYTNGDFFPHLANRKDAYVWLPDGVNPEYILLDMRTSQFGSKIWDSSPKDTLANLSAHLNYFVVASSKGVILMKLDYEGPPVISEPYSIRFSENDLIIESGNSERRTDSVNPFVLVHSPADPRATYFWFGPYAPFPPGNYTAKFSLMADDISRGNVISLDVSISSGTEILASRKITGDMFNASEDWVVFSLPFTLWNFDVVEFRGFNVNPGITIYLDYIDVDQVTLP